MQNREMKIQNNGVTLAGTLTLPPDDDPRPLVICIHGSGPLDRDSNTKFQKLDVFNTLAENLGSQGISCFRYDKRGIGQSTGDYMSAGHSDFVQDALAITRHFRNSGDFSHIFLLGHSEGTIIAPQVADQCPVEGMILIAPFVTNLEELLEHQGTVMQEFIDQAKGPAAWFSRLFTSLNGGVVAGNRRLIRKVRNSAKPVLWDRFRKVEAKWIRELVDVDPAEIFATLDTDTLILVAGNDLQCPPEDGKKIASIIGSKATHVVIPGLSHMLRMEGDKGGYADYERQLKQPMAPEVSQTIIRWLEQRVSGQSEPA